MKRICIVGSSGYIGSYLVSELKENYRVISHSRKKIKDTDFNKKITKHIIGDITKNSTIKKNFKILILKLLSILYLLITLIPS